MIQATIKAPLPMKYALFRLDKVFVGIVLRSLIQVYGENVLTDK